MNYKLLFSLLIICLCNLTFAQDTYLRFDFSKGHSKFVGGDDASIVDSATYSFGLIIEHEVAGNSIINSDHGRYYYGLRYRHLQAGSLGAEYNGYASYTYDYLEVPLGIQTDWISLFKHSLVIGTDLAIFGTYPLKVSGERTGPQAIPWSEKYERPWFILGFQIGLYAGLNFADTFGAKVGVMTQFPFIPITTSTPDNWAGPEYKTQLLTDSGLQFSINYKF